MKNFISKIFSFRNQIIIVVVALSVIPLILLGINALYLAGKSQKDVSKIKNILLYDMSREVEEYFMRVNKDLAFTSKIENYKGSDNSKRNMILLNAVQKNQDIVGLGYVQKGKLISFFGDDMKKSEANKKFDILFKESGKSKIIQISNSFKYNEKYLFDLLYPLDNNDYIYAVFKLTSLIGRLEAKNVGDTGKFIIVNENNFFIGKEKIESKLNFSEIMDVIKSPKENATDDTGIDVITGQRSGYQIIAKKIEGMLFPFWTVFIQELREANALIWKLKSTTVFALVIIALLSGIISFKLAMNFSRPIANLLVAVKKNIESKVNAHAVLDKRDSGELALLIRSFNNMINSIKERDFIKDTFGKYVSKQVADEILSGKVQLGGERIKATVLMIDIRDFTPMSKKLSPEKVVKFLNNFFTDMGGVVTKYEGTLDKYIGDALLAIFGAPIAHKDDPKRAVFTALEMKDKLELLNVNRKKEGKDPIRVGIGVSTGEIVAGNIGSEVRMEYTAIGDTVNLAARLEKINKKFGTTILISETTYNEVKDFVDVREIPDVQIKGFEGLIKIYNLINKKQNLT